MKRFDENDLIAYHLQELSPRQAHALEQALQTDPTLAADSEAIAATLLAFKPGVSAPLDDQTLLRNWNALRPTLKTLRAPAPRPFRWHIPVFVSVGLAFVIATSLMKSPPHQDALAPLQISSVLAPDDADPSTSPLGSPNATPPPANRERALIREDGLAAPDQPFHSHNSDELASLPHPRFLSSAPQGEEQVPVVHLIPLATAPPPALPPPTPPITFAPAPPPQAGQDKGSSKSAASARKKLFAASSHTSLSLGSTAQLAAARSGDTNIATASFTPSAGVLATFRHSFKPWLGFSVNLGYTRASEHYTLVSNAVSQARNNETIVPANIYEGSISYIALKPLTTRMTAFAEAGGGTVAFAAAEHAGDMQRSGNTYRPEAIAGVGFDYQLTNRLALRAQYRGLFVRYPFPDYSDSGTPRTLVSEPAVSIVYDFRKH